MSKVATLTLPPRGFPPLQSGVLNQRWPTSGQRGDVTPTAWGVPTVSQRGAESEVAHKWARWLHNACRQGGTHRFRAGNRFRSGQQVGKVATQPLPSRGSPPLQGGRHNAEVAHKSARWVHNPCCLGVPTASERGAQSEVAHKWARWLHNPCRLGGPHHFGAGGTIRSGPQVGKVATQPLPPKGSRALESGWQDQKWRTSGEGGYITLATWGVPTASEREGECRGGPQVSNVATLPLLPWRFPPLQSGRQHRRWPPSWRGGYITPAAWGVPTASEGGAGSEGAHKWARWLNNLCRLRGPHRFRAGGKIRGGPNVGKVATQPLPPRGPHRFTAGGGIGSSPQLGKVVT